MVALIEHVLPLGQTVATPGSLEALQEAGQTPLEFLERHRRGDWGDVCGEDWTLNNLAREQGDRILSAYRTTKGKKLWVITEWDRSATTILLPDEY